MIPCSSRAFGTRSRLTPRALDTMEIGRCLTGRLPGRLLGRAPVRNPIF
ncbi:hypothetical protein APY03_6079 [Variovorax sp. WDL1]|nr:hypothetical protein APY03_6079 [Variovorax sp. WDL1]